MNELGVTTTLYFDLLKLGYTYMFIGFCCHLPAIFASMSVYQKSYSAGTLASAGSGLNNSGFLALTAGARSMVPMIGINAITAIFEVYFSFMLLKAFWKF